MKLAVGTKIHNHIEAFHRFFKEGNVSWLRAGRELIILKRLEVWKNDGTDGNSWREWTEKSLLISGTTADRLIRIADRYGAIMDANPVYADVDMTKLELLPDSSNDGQEELLAWIEKARNLSVRALKDEIRETKGKVATDVCLHNGELETFNRCTACGKFLRAEGQG
jgi:hypothetical protein